MASLPDDLYRTWTFCLCVAQEHDYKTGSLPNIDDLSYTLHMEPEECMSRLSRLVTLGFLELSGNVFLIHDWDDWKLEKDHTAAERKRRQRAKEREDKQLTPMLKQEDVTVSRVTQDSVTRHASYTTTTTEADAEADGVTESRDVCTPQEHSIKSPEAKRVIKDASRRWSAIDLEAEIQAAEIVRCWGAKDASRALDKAFRSLGPSKRPWQYAAKLCREGMPPESDRRESSGAIPFSGTDYHVPRVPPTEAAS